MNKVDFCFRLEKEVGMARDTDTNEPAECYAKMTLEFIRVPSDEEYYAMQGNMRSTLAKQLDTDIEHITPITYEEWAENQDEEDEVWEA